MKQLFYGLSLWLSVISLGLWVGGTLFHILVVQPMWTANPPSSVQFFFTKTKFNETIWNFFGPPWMITRLLPLLLCILLGWTQAQEQRFYLFTAGICWIFITLYTLAYIYPMNEILFIKAGGNNSDGVIQALVRKWLFADRLRFVIGSMGYLSLLHVFRSNV